MSIAAWYLLKGRHREFARRSFDGGLALATVSALAMLVSGHRQADNVYRHQPAKLAAFEGHYQTGKGALNLFGVPDDATRTVKYGVGVPGGLGLLLHGDASAQVVGLDRFRPEDRPPVGVTFQSYHVMVGLGFSFIGLTLFASFLRWRGTLYDTRWLLWLFVPAVVLPIAANELGWVAAEVGRQPWIVHPKVTWTADGSDLVVGPAGTVVYDEREGLRTLDAASPNVTAGQVLGSLIGFGLVYLALGAVWVFILDRKIKHGPDAAGHSPPGTGEGALEAAGLRAVHEGRLTGDDGARG
jgi:cytochrome d ubiquinol oxidase subunit I